MEINITGRNMDLNGAIKEYIHKKLDKMERLYRRIYKCEVILEEESVRKNAEIILYLKRNRVIGKETSPDIYTSIDSAAFKVKNQLSRLRERVVSKRRRNMFKRIMRPITGFRDRERIVIPEGIGRVIKTNVFADKPMLPEEAKLELELSKKVFIMFKNADTGEINVLYKRGDGNYGLVEPSF